MEEREFLLRLGMAMRLERISRNLTVKELSELADMKMNCIYQLERGKRNGHILNYKRVCDTLGIELTSILPM